MVLVRPGIYDCRFFGFQAGHDVAKIVYMPYWPKMIFTASANLSTE